MTINSQKNIYFKTPPLLMTTSGDSTPEPPSIHSGHGSTYATSRPLANQPTARSISSSILTQSDEVARVVVHVKRDVPWAWKVEEMGFTTLDVDTYPENMQSTLRSSINNVGKILQRMIDTKDGPEKIHLIVLESLEANAFTFINNNDEKVVAITLGLLGLVHNDAELAYVLAHELEHHHSQSGKKSSIDSIGALLRRSEEIEVDVKAVVDRMTNANLPPSAATQLLTRVKEGERTSASLLDLLTHPMIDTRINAINAAIATMNRSGTRDRNQLEDTDTTDTLGPARELVNEGRMNGVLISKAESLLTHVPDEIGFYYTAIKNNNIHALPKAHRSGRYEEPVHTFETIFRRQWRKIGGTLPPSVDSAQRVEYQLRLAKNLHEASEQQRIEILGDNFAATTPQQFEAMIEMALRNYPIDVPNLSAVLLERDRLEKEKAELEAEQFDPDLDRGTEEGWNGKQQEKIAAKEDKLAENKRQIEAAKALYEPGETLDEFVNGGYKGDRALHTMDVRGGVSANSRIRYIHSLVADAPKIEERMRREGQVRAVLAATDIRGFIGALEQTRLYAVSDDDKGRILAKAGQLLDSAHETIRNPDTNKWQRTSSVKDVTNMLAVFHRWRDQLGDGYRRFITSELRRAPDIAEYFERYEDLHPVILVANGLIDEDINRDLRPLVITLVLKDLDTVRGMRERLKRLNQLNTEYLREYGRDLLLGGEETILDAIERYFSGQFREADITITPQQLKALLYIEVPSLIPTTMTPEGLAQVRRDFVELCKNDEFRNVIGRRFFDFYDVAHVFAESEASKGEEERGLEAEIKNKSANDSHNVDTFERLDAVRETKRAGLYDLFIETPEDIWGVRNEDGSERRGRGGSFDWSNELHDELLTRLKSKRPYDLYHAGLIIMESALLGDSGKAFLEASWQWHLNQEKGNIEKAAYRFWKAFDTSRIMLSNENLYGIRELISSLLVGKNDGREGNINTENLVAYIRGLRKFITEAGDNLRTVCSERDCKEKRALSSPEEIFYFEAGLRVDGWDMQDAWKDRRNYENEDSALIAEVLQFYLHTVRYGGGEDAVAFLWEHREDNGVKEILRDPIFVETARYQSLKVDIATWQLSQVEGVANYLADYRGGRAQLPAKGEVRRVIRDCHELLKAQFKEPSPASYRALEYVERNLLPNEEESKLLGDLRLNEDNWVDQRVLYGPDLPDYLASKLGSGDERLSLIRYLIGSSEDPPTLKVYSAEDIKKFMDHFTRNGELFQTLALQAIIGNKVASVDSTTYTSLRDIILGSASSNVPLKALFDTYMDVLPAGERKLLLANALALYDPKEGGRFSIGRLLDVAGPLGAKAKQALVESGLVTGDMRKDLMTSFDDILPPTRTKIFEQLKEAFGGNYDKIERVGRLLGSGSLNYVVEVYIRDGAKLKRVSVRIQKEHVSGQIENEHTLWERVYPRLEESKDPQIRRYGRLVKSMIEEAYSSLHVNGVELDLEQERQRYDDAKKAYGQETADPTTNLKIEVVAPDLELQQMIVQEHQRRTSVYEYVDHVKLEDIEDTELRAKIAAQIVAAERRAVDGGGFDSDGHKGNWLIDLKGSRLVRCDYAQFGKHDTALFKKVFRDLIKPATDDLFRLIGRRFTEVFDVNTAPSDLAAAIEHVKELRNMPPIGNPMERLIFIQNELELYYASQNLDFRLRPSISKAMGSFLRQNMYRETVGEAPFFTTLLTWITRNTQTPAQRPTTGGRAVTHGRRGREGGFVVLPDFSFAEAAIRDTVDLSARTFLAVGGEVIDHFRTEQERIYRAREGMIAALETTFEDELSRDAITALFDRLYSNNEGFTIKSGSGAEYKNLSGEEAIFRLIAEEAAGRKCTLVDPVADAKEIDPTLPLRVYEEVVRLAAQDPVFINTTMGGAANFILADIISEAAMGRWKYASAKHAAYVWAMMGSVGGASRVAIAKAFEFAESQMKRRMSEKGFRILTNGSSYTLSKRFVQNNLPTLMALAAMQAVESGDVSGYALAETMGTFAVAHPVTATVMKILSKTSKIFGATGFARIVATAIDFIVFKAIQEGITSAKINSAMSERIEKIEGVVADIGKKPSPDDMSTWVDELIELKVQGSSLRRGLAEYQQILTERKAHIYGEIMYGPYIGRAERQKAWELELETGSMAMYADEIREGEISRRRNDACKEIEDDPELKEAEDALMADIAGEDDVLLGLAVREKLELMKAGVIAEFYMQSIQMEDDEKRGLLASMLSFPIRKQYAEQRASYIAKYEREMDPRKKAQIIDWVVRKRIDLSWFKNTELATIYMIQQEIEGGNSENTVLYNNLAIAQ